MQTIAVGMEQVILDRAVYGGDFLEEFATTESRLGMVTAYRTWKLIEHCWSNWKQMSFCRFCARCKWLWWRSKFNQMLMQRVKWCRMSTETWRASQDGIFVTSSSCGTTLTCSSILSRCCSTSKALVEEYVQPPLALIWLGHKLTAYCQVLFIFSRDVSLSSPLCL